MCDVIGVCPGIFWKLAGFLASHFPLRVPRIAKSSLASLLPLGACIAMLCCVFLFSRSLLFLLLFLPQRGNGRAKPGSMQLAVKTRGEIWKPQFSSFRSWWICPKIGGKYWVNLLFAGRTIRMNYANALRFKSSKNGRLG